VSYEFVVVASLPKSDLNERSFLKSLMTHLLHDESSVILG
jgi:hypothetical protein